MPCAPVAIRDGSTRCQEWPGEKICAPCSLPPAVFHATRKLDGCPSSNSCPGAASIGRWWVENSAGARAWRRANVWSDHILAHGSCVRRIGRIDCLRHRNGCGISSTRACMAMADKCLIVWNVIALNSEAIGVRNPASKRAAALAPNVIQSGGRQFKFGDTPLHQYHRASERSKTLTVTSKGQSEIIDRDDLNANQNTLGIKSLSRSSSPARVHQPPINCCRRGITVPRN